MLHQTLLILGAVSRNLYKVIKIKPKQIPLFLQALQNHKSQHKKIFFSLLLS
jgi:hypothetical protein